MSETTLAAYAALADSNNTTLRMLCKIAIGELSGTSQTVIDWTNWREQIFKIALQETSVEELPTEPESPLT